MGNGGFIRNVIVEEALVYSQGRVGPHRPSQVVLLQASRLDYAAARQLAIEEGDKGWVVATGRLTRTSETKLQFLPQAEQTVSESSDLESVCSDSSQHRGQGRSRRKRTKRSSARRPAKRAKGSVGVQKRVRAGAGEDRLGEGGDTQSDAKWGGRGSGGRLRCQTGVTYAEEGVLFTPRPLKTLRGKGKGVGIGASQLLGAGMGLFTTARFLENTVVCTYAGYVISKDWAHRNRSQYMWSDAGETIFIDARDPKSCYGRYINDPLNEHLDNVRIEVGEDGTARVIALRIIEPHEELYMSYGAAYWRDVKGVPAELQVQAAEAYELRRRSTKRTRRAQREAAEGPNTAGTAFYVTSDSEPERRTEEQTVAVEVDSTIEGHDCGFDGGQEREWGGVG